MSDDKFEDVLTIGCLIMPLPLLLIILPWCVDVPPSHKYGLTFIGIILLIYVASMYLGPKHQPAASHHHIDMQVAATQATLRQPRHSVEMVTLNGNETCSFCRSPLISYNLPLVKCNGCGNILHEECLGSNFNKCTVYGCLCRTFTKVKHKENSEVEVILL